MSSMSSSDQILFRLTSVETVSCRGAKKVQFTINRTLQLKQPTARPSSSSPYSQSPREASKNSEAVDFSQIQASIDLNRNDIDRLDTAGFWVVSALDEAVRRVEAETNKLQKSVQELRRDFGGNRDDITFLKTGLKHVEKITGGSATSVISRLESQVQSVSEAVPNLQELAAFSTISRNDIQRLESQLSQAKQESGQLKNMVESSALTIEENNIGLKSLRTEVSTLKDVLNQRSVPQSPDRSTGLSNRELDILTENIARIGSRASQVETLQMQFEILKGRVERMDDERVDASITLAHPSNHRKRPIHDVQQIGTSPKSDTSHRADRLDSPSVKKPKLTKSGTVDKRTQKRCSKRS